MKMHPRSLLMGLILALGLFAASLSPAQAFFGLSVGIAPPALPEYAQPDCPGSGYIWTPGYWAWSSWNNDYYWVPGTWVLAPEVGLLWTPGWWSCDNGAYYYNNGYWGQNVGFYGGIDYGHGYFGRGYDGGYWHNGHFLYNRTYNNVGRVGRGDVYSRAAADRANGSRVSYNGGTGGIAARPTAAEITAQHEHHVGVTSAQAALARSAAGNPGSRYGENHGHPAVLATTRPDDFHPAAAHTAAPASHRSSLESLFTGESHTAATSEREHQAGVNATEHRAAASEESHHKASSGGIFHSFVSHAVTPTHSASSHAPTFHSASHAPAARSEAHGAAHASAGHADAPRR